MPTQPAPELAPGAIVGQYELIRELGRGGMGRVFAARDTVLGRRVAIKFVLKATGEVAERFLIEARALARCEHPNIVVIHAVDQYQGLPYLVLELLEGHSFFELMHAATLPATRVVELIVPVARALERAHELGIVHRDLKPENVMLTTAGQIKVLDFGIAKAASDERAGTQRLTQQHALLGTLTYMSPEQMGTDTVDERSDVWALGILMFEMLAGHHPIEDLTPEALITNAVTDDPMPSIGKVAHDVPPALARIVDACLVKARDKRMSSAELVRALEALVPGRHVRALGDGESPYPGLSAFQEADAGRFFGRDSEIARMVTRVRELPLTGVIGPSGAGKSSFVRAGVGPALKASGESWEVVSLRPGRSPILSLAALVQRVTAGGDDSAQAELARRLRSEHGYLGTLLRTHAKTHKTNVLVFVDQLEELFTLVGDPTERRAFTAALVGAADDASAPVRVVVAMRADFLDRLVDHPGFVDELSRGFTLLATPDRAGLRDALEQPLALYGHAFESHDIVDDMLNALDGVSGALPLLQFAAAKLWDGRDPARKLITTETYRAIGGISGALATHADDVLAKMDSSAQRLTRKMFRALVTPERTRAVVEVGDLYALADDRGEAGRVIDQLVAARLVVVQKRSDGGGGTVELVHESLIERWPTLRHWLEEDQEDATFLSQVAAAAKQWDQRGRPGGLLWRGDAAAESGRWMTMRPRELAPRERAFLTEVQAQTKRGQRRRRRVVIASFIALGAIAAGAMVAVVEVNKAREQAMRKSDEASEMAGAWKNAVEAKTEAEKAKALLEARRLQAEHDNQAISADLVAAERDKQAAEAQRLAAEREAQAAEERRLAAEREKAVAESEVKLKESQVVESREALQRKNKDLEAALKDSRAAADRAEAAHAEAERSKAELQKALEKEQARVKALEQEKKKISTQLRE